MKKSKKFLTALLIAFGAFAVMAALGPVRGYVNFTVSGIAALVLTMAYTYIILKYVKSLNKRQIMLAIFVGIIIIQVPVRIWWYESLISLPDAVCYFVGAGLGYLLYVAGKWMKAVVVLVALAIAVGYVYFYPYYFDKLVEFEISRGEDIKNINGVWVRNSNSESLTD